MSLYMACISSLCALWAARAGLCAFVRTGMCELYVLLEYVLVVLVWAVFVLEWLVLLVLTLL